jgi:hypothetical protein
MNEIVVVLISPFIWNKAPLELQSIVSLPHISQICFLAYLSYFWKDN